VIRLDSDIMPEHTLREISKIVREYFDEIKKTKYAFDVVSINYDDDDESWIMVCEVTNFFDEAAREYVIIIDDETGEIQDVSEVEGE